jgi:flagellar biosynthesis protein
LLIFAPQAIRDSWEFGEANVADERPADDTAPHQRAEDRPAAPETALAVALKYEPKTEFAPKVVASGRGSVAEQILAIAFAKGIKVREDADLAELLSLIDIDSEIPIEAFAAVAEVLAYVYRANGDWPDFIERVRQAATPDPNPPRPS